LLIRTRPLGNDPLSLPSTEVSGSAQAPSRASRRTIIEGGRAPYNESDIDEYKRLQRGPGRQHALTYCADSAKKKPGEFNTHFDGRGIYWEDPIWHFLEIITRPYGST